MKPILMLLIGLLLFQFPAPAQVRDVDLGISVSDGRLRDFYFAIGDYYRVPAVQVVQFRDRYRCPEEDLPVVYFLAARARVEPAVIIGLRMHRMSWLDIAFRYRLTPDIFYMPVNAYPIGPPYGNAYGYYRKFGPRREWKKFALTDREIVDLVNLRFLSEHYRMAPESVMAMRAREHRFLAINEEINKARMKGKPEKPQTPDMRRDDRGKGKKRR